MYNIFSVHNKGCSMFTGETQTDRNVLPGVERYYIWALGSLNSEGLVTKHTERGKRYYLYTSN